MTSTWAAESSFDARDPHGRSFAVTVRIGMPQAVTEDEWACAVETAGLHDALAAIRGGSAIQALALAVLFARRLLQAFLDSGGGLSYPGTDVALELSAEFGSSDSSPDHWP